jgi:type IV secretion system protein VirD4
VAGTRVGKTTSVVIPILLEHQGPTIATSVKADLVDATIRQRQLISGSTDGVMIFDPAGITRYKSSSWSPILASQTWSEAQATASSLVAAGMSDGGENSEYWTQTSSSLISVLLHAAAIKKIGMKGCLAWLNLLTTASDDERMSIYEAIQQAQAQGASSMIEQKFRAFCGEDKKTQANQVSMVKSILGVYENERVLELADGDDPITYERLVSGNNTLFLVAPPAEQLQYKSVFACLIEHLIDRGMKDGTPLDPPLCVMLEEAGNVAPLPKLPTYLSTSAGLGITFCTIWQSLSQIKETYGENGIGTVLENSGGLIVLGNIRDQETLNRLSQMVGDEEVRETKSISRAHDGTKSETISIQPRPLLHPAVIREQKMGEGILILENRPPIKLNMRQYFDDPILSKLAGNHSTPNAVTPQPAIATTTMKQLPRPCPLELPQGLDRLLSRIDAEYYAKNSRPQP